jgi:hypothetical protein
MRCEENNPNGEQNATDSIRAKVPQEGLIINRPKGQFWNGYGRGPSPKVERYREDKKKATKPTNSQDRRRRRQNPKRPAPVSPSLRAFSRAFQSGSLRSSSWGSSSQVRKNVRFGSPGKTRTCNPSVNSRGCQNSKCPIWCRLHENGGHSSLFSCTHSCTQLICPNAARECSQPLSRSAPNHLKGNAFGPHSAKPTFQDLAPPRRMLF